VNEETNYDNKIPWGERYTVGRGPGPCGYCQYSTNKLQVIYIESAQKL